MLHILDLEQFAFDLLNTLSDEYDLHDDGSFTQAIWETTDPEKMQSIINQLQAIQLQAMKSRLEVMMKPA